MSPPSLWDLSLQSMAAALSRGTGPCAVGALAGLPVAAATALWSLLCERLAEPGMAPSPPIAAVRLFYGGQLERLRQSGANDEWADEALGCGLRRLHALSLPAARGLSEFCLGQLACGLPQLRELSISGCRGLGAAGVAQLGRLGRLEKLALTDCALALDAPALAPLLALERLDALDLGGNRLPADGALALFQPRGGVPLRVLRLGGSEADDACAAAAMGLAALEELDLGWSALSGEGLQCIAVALGPSLRALHVAHVARLSSTDALWSTCLPAFRELRSLTLAGHTLERDDLDAVAALPCLCRLDLADGCVRACACDASRALGRAAALHTLTLTQLQLAPPRPDLDVVALGDLEAALVRLGMEHGVPAAAHVDADATPVAAGEEDEDGGEGERGGGE